MWVCVQTYIYICNFKKFFELNFLFCGNTNPKFLGVTLHVKLTCSWKEMAMVSTVKGSVFGRLTHRNSWHALSTLTMISPWQLWAKLTQLLGTWNDKVSPVQYINSVSSFKHPKQILVLWTNISLPNFKKQALTCLQNIYAWIYAYIEVLTTGNCEYHNLWSLAIYRMFLKIWPEESAKSSKEETAWLLRSFNKFICVQHTIVKILA